MLSTEHTAFFLIGFAVYVAFMIAIGIFAARGKSSGKDYLTGGGQLPIFLVFATMGATLIGTGSSIGATSNGFKFGWGGSAYGLGAALGIIALVLLARKTKLRSKNFLTMAEEAQYHYNGNISIKNVMAVMMFIIEIIWLGNHINGGATYLSYITGLDLILSKVITVLAFGIYVIIGGYLAVVWTDAVQLMILLVGFIVVTAIAIPSAGGWGTITSTIAATGNAGNLSFYGVETLGVMGLISLIYTIAIPCLGTPTYRMRIYTSKDDKSATTALSMSAVLLLVFSLVPAVIGMAAFTMAVNGNVTAVLERPDFAFTYVSTQVLGPVMGLFFMLAGLSATLSSGDSDAIAGVTILIQDIYPMITGKELPEKKIASWSRVGVVVTLACAFFATLFAQDVMSYISNVIGSIIPGVSIAMLLGVVWKRTTWQGGLASILSGTAFGVTYLLVAPFKSWIVGIFTGPAIPATIVAVVFAVVVSLCTKNERLSEEQRMACVIAQRGVAE